MPQHNRRFPRRKRGKKRYRNSLAKVKKDVDWLKKGIEFKFIDLAGSGQVASSSGTIISFNNLINNGTEHDERVGERVACRRIFMRGHFANDRGTPADVVVRMILFRQLDSLSSAATLAELLQTPTNIHSAMNMDNASKMKVYVDTTFAMDTSGHTLIPFKISQKLNHIVKWSAPGIGQPHENGLYLGIFSTQSTAANAPDLDLYARYSYTDS